MERNVIVKALYLVFIPVYLLGLKLVFFTDRYLQGLSLCALSGLVLLYADQYIYKSKSHG